MEPVLGADHDVLEDGQPRTEPDTLQSPGDPELGQIVGMVVLEEPGPVIGEASRVGTNEPADDVEQGRLPGAVGSDDTHDLPLARRHRHLVEGDDPPESHTEFVDDECLSRILGVPGSSTHQELPRAMTGGL